MIRSHCPLKLAPKVVEMCSFNPSFISCKLAFPYPVQLAESQADWRHDHGSSSMVDASFGSIVEEEEEEVEDERQTATAGKQDTADRSISSSSLSSIMSAHSQGAAMKNRQMVRCMCSSALMLVSITALLLFLPLMLPPLPPPPSELMLLPVAILLLLICAALSPRSPSLPSAVAVTSSQSIPLLPLPHSLPVRSNMPL